MKEAGALKDLIVFRRLKESARDPVVRSIKVYARAVIGTEWRALSGCSTTEKIDKLFLEIVSAVAELKLDNPFEGAWNLSSDPFNELLTKFR